MALLLRRTARQSALSVQRWASASAVPMTESIEAANPAPNPKLASEEVKVTILGNGITVASVENQSFLSNIAVYVRAGSRYETYSQTGLTHLLRNCAFLATGDRSAFRIAREVDLLGSSVSATSTREHMIYSANFLRGNLAPMFDNLASSVTSPQFQPWEVNDQRPVLNFDLAAAEKQPNTVVLEELHRIAFRNALSNSLYCPPYNVSKLTHDDLKSYFEEWYTGRRMTVVGMGVSHDELVKHTEASLSGIPEGMSSTDEQCEYVGGCESRIPSGSPFTHAAVVCRGTSSTGAQSDLLAAGVLQHMLGAAPLGYVKWGSNSAASRLGKAAAGAVDVPCAVTAINLNYSDNGLFGIYTVCEGSAIAKLLQSVMKEFSEVVKGSISEEDLSRARNQLKASYMMSSEIQDILLEDVGMQASVKGSYTQLADTLKQVDSVTKDDVIKFARAVFATRATLVAHGNLSNTPRLDRLLADISLK